jgi:subtilisin family serine protease
VRPALLALATVLALIAPVQAAAGRISVGVAPEASRDAVAEAVARATGGDVTHDLGPLEAVVVRVPDTVAATATARAVPGVTFAEPIEASRSLAFRPNDPLAGAQWYLAAIRAFDHWPVRPPQPPVRVAVIDSGIDGGHPELAGRVVASRSFVGGSALVDPHGHGTMVAGEIAAAIDNGAGIAGVGIPVELVVARVVGSTGTISLLAEARAIRWAVDNGAQVVNLSIGGVRDPRDPGRDSYSALEHAAVDYAVRRGVVVVAAAGNCAATRCPEPYATWPAALPHVIGVGALRPDGAVPGFSNRDRHAVDLAAPGTNILSTYPRDLSDARCPHVGFTLCAADEARRAPRGTSFSAPLVSAAAAVLLGERRLRGLGRPHASQVRRLLLRGATDVGRPGWDRGAGSGGVNVDASLAAAAGALPPRDRFEPNDDAGPWARRLGTARRAVRATLDSHDDARDVYRVHLRRGQRLQLSLRGPNAGQSDLFLWRPGTESVLGTQRRRANRLAYSARRGARDRIRFRVRATGSHYVEVRLAGGRPGEYRLTVARR